MCKLAVIVPVYNAEKTLSRCINSIISQTYKDLILILVNDGSNDRSPEICDDYSLKDNRVKVIHKPNGGLSSARNAGIDYQLSLGNEYIAFVDSDDYIDARMYEVMISDIEKNQSDISVCLWSYEFANGNIYNPEYDSNIKISNELLTGRIFLEKYLYSSSYNNGVTIAPWNKIYKKSIFKKQRFIGKISEDEEIIHKIIKFDSKISTVNKSFYFYVQNFDSITNRKFNKDRLSMLSILMSRKEYLKESSYLYKRTILLFLNLTMEYYTRPEMRNKGNLFKEYIKDFKRILKEEKRTLDYKTKRRAQIFHFHLIYIDS